MVRTAGREEMPGGRCRERPGHPNRVAPPGPGRTETSARRSSAGPRSLQPSGPGGAGERRKDEAALGDAMAPGRGTQEQPVPGTCAFARPRRSGPAHRRPGSGADTQTNATHPTTPPRPAHRSPLRAGGKWPVRRLRRQVSCPIDCLGAPPSAPSAELSIPGRG